MNSVRQRGFTLIELAIVLAIVGLMTGAGMFGINALRENTRQKEANTALRDAEYALTLYVIRQGRLPWADTTVPPDGLEDVNGTDGVVPWDTLGLARGDVVDGWDNLLRYAVDPIFVNVANEELSCLRVPANLQTNFQNTGALTLEDLAGGGMSVAYVLVSHGSNGLGAMGVGGAARPAATSANETENTDADITFRAEGQAAGGDFDDIASGRGAGQILRDTGCRQVSELTGGGGGGTGSGGGDPGTVTGAQVDFSDEMFQRAFRQTGDATGQRFSSPDVAVNPGGDDDAPNTVTFPAGTSNGNQEWRSCIWTVFDMRLKNSTLRSYFEVSFASDSSGTSSAGSKKDGLVQAFLPWEVGPTSTLCGAEGAHLGFGSDNGLGGTGSLVKASDFVGTYSGLPTPIGLELDVALTNEKVQSQTFYDPYWRSSTNAVDTDLGGNGKNAIAKGELNHIALVTSDVLHDNDPDCTTGNAACDYPAEATTSARHFLEQGASNFHKVRMEIEDNSATCGAGAVHVRAWVWEAGADCTGDCADITQDYSDILNGQTPSPMPFIVARCITKPDALGSTDVGNGWIAHAWDKVRPGFTAGLGKSSESTQPVIRSFIAGSYPKWTIPADAASTEVSAEIRNDQVDSGLNWNAIGVIPTSQPGYTYEEHFQRWTRATWIDLPAYGAEVLSAQGEITVSGSRYYGFGVRGIGGPQNQYYSNPIDDVLDPTHRGEASYREMLTFKMNKRYTKVRAILTAFNNINSDAEGANVIIGTAADASSQRAYAIEACRADTSDTRDGSATILEITSSTPFDTIAFTPEPRPSGEVSDFWVRNLRFCGDDTAASCTLYRSSDASCSITVTP